ncbi:MAG TPA: M48 family metalloprotease [Terriglobales bacterium]|nr:M48 family metalloprotease [Terriglobales bacterium]
MHRQALTTRITRYAGFALIASLLPALAAAQSGVALDPTVQAQIVNRIAAQEHNFTTEIARFQPRIETYIQSLGPDRDRGTVPVSDAYFLGTLSTRKGFAEPLFTGANAGKLAGRFFPTGFAGMITPDRERFDQRHYTFTFEGRQFLGGVRCVMFDVTPISKRDKGSFIGRIWAEDQGFNIVRFDGTYVPNPRNKYVHFDSWRANMGPNLWLPVAIYSQETDQRTGWFSHIDFKAQTRFWGYQLSATRPATSLTDIQVDAANGVDDQSQTAHDKSPLAQQRAWELKAENDVLDRMEKAGLLAPPGPVDKVLATVVNNLEVTNNLNLDPEVRVRVMLTSPLESFTVGHTIVISRGYIDVLPDEACLAMALAHELGHIALNHGINTDYAFDDKMFFPDTQSFERLQVARSPAEEAAADQKGIEILEHSPYKDKLASAGLFLEALQHSAAGVPNLITPHMGNPMVIKGRVDRMQALLARAPQLQVRDLKQVAALPLGARIQVDPWSDQLSLLQAPPEPLLSARDKLTFEITPYMPYLTRESAAETTASSGSR